MSDDLSIPNPGYRGKRAGRFRGGASRRRQGMDPDTRRLMLFAGAVGGLLALLIVASFLTNRPSGQVPIVAADPSPIRVKPDNPGGMKIDAAENDVFSGGSDTQNARLSKPAEAPDTTALEAAEAATQPRAAAARTAEPSPRGAAPPPARVQDLPPPIPLPSPPAPAVIATPSLVRPVLPALPRNPPNANTRLAAPAPAPQQSSAEQQAGSHVVAVQLATMPTETGAKEEWQRLSHRLAALFDNHAMNVSRTDRDGHAFWRLRTTGFTDIAQARDFCAQVHDKGGNCTVTDF